MPKQYKLSLLAGAAAGFSAANWLVIEYAHAILPLAFPAAAIALACSALFNMERHHTYRLAQRIAARGGFPQKPAAQQGGVEALCALITKCSPSDNGPV